MNEGTKGMPDILLQIYVNIFIVLTGGWSIDIRNSSIYKSGVSKKKIVVWFKGKMYSSFYLSEKVKADVPTSSINVIETYLHAD
jgi:hypothetical protein